MALVLGIESSCDETAVALVDSDRRIVAQRIASQDAEHAPFGGVVPEIAARAHAERLAPMMEYVATQAPELRVGRVNASEYNGIPRTFEVTKFPFILLFDSNNVVYEFHGTRSPPRLIAFARGDPTLLGAGRPAPTQLKDNVSDWWLLAEAFWGPLKTAATWSLGITLSLKLCATGALRLLRRPPKDPKAKPPEKAS